MWVKPARSRRKDSRSAPAESGHFLGPSATLSAFGPLSAPFLPFQAMAGVVGSSPEAVIQQPPDKPREGEAVNKEGRLQAMGSHRT